MSGAWVKGSVAERLLVKWRRSAPAATEPIAIFDELKQARKVLIVPNDRVGGLFIGAPIYKAIRHHYPDTEIHLLSDAPKAVLAGQIPFIDEVVSGDLRQPVWRNTFNDITRRLRLEQFDIALCLGPDCSFRLALICGASGARLRVGFRRQGIEPFNVEIVRRSTQVYEGDQYLIMLRLLGLEGCGEVKWAISQEHAQHVRSRYLDGEFSHGNVVAVDLSRGEGRGMSGRQMDDIVGRVIERGARAVLFFSLAEKKQVNYLKKTYGSRILAFEQDDLASVAAILEGCRALISCNTDLLHLAISLLIPAVGIFEEDSQRWISPHNQLVKVVQARDIRAANITQVVRALERALNLPARPVPA